MTDDELERLVRELTADLSADDPIIGEVRTLLHALRDLASIVDLKGAC